MDLQSLKGLLHFHLRWRRLGLVAFGSQLIRRLLLNFSDQCKYFVEGLIPQGIQDHIDFFYGEREFNFLHGGLFFLIAIKSSGQAATLQGTNSASNKVFFT